MKETVARLATCSLVAGSLLLAACSILAPQPDSSQFFVLAPLADATTPRTGSASQALPDAVLGLGPIKLPPYLDRNEVATRLSPTQITYSTVDRWAEPLSVSVSRVLLLNLSLLVGTDRIVTYPWPNIPKVDYQIEIELLSFDITTTGETQLLARYGILEGHTRRPLVVREANFSRPAAADTPAAVTALSASLGDLSQDIAAALRQLPKPQAAPPGTRRTS